MWNPLGRIGLRAQSQWFLNLCDVPLRNKVPAQCTPLQGQFLEEVARQLQVRIVAQTGHTEKRIVSGISTEPQQYSLRVASSVEPYVLILQNSTASNWKKNLLHDYWPVPFVFNSNIYILLDGLSYNTRGYFASCVVFFRAPQGRGKMRAMSKMSASIIC